MTQIFVDTSAFVALTDKKDRNHSAAKRCLQTLARARRPLVTSTYVADEVITLVRMRLGHAVALTAGEALLESRWCELIDIDESLRERAWSIFSTYSDQTFSFTDCTSFALMKSLGGRRRLHLRPPRLCDRGLQRHSERCLSQKSDAGVLRGFPPLQRPGDANSVSAHETSQRLR